MYVQTSITALKHQPNHALVSLEVFTQAPLTSFELEGSTVEVVLKHVFRDMYSVACPLSEEIGTQYKVSETILLNR